MAMLESDNHVRYNSYDHGCHCGCASHVTSFLFVEFFDADKLKFIEYTFEPKIVPGICPYSYVKSVPTEKSFEILSLFQFIRQNGIDDYYVDSNLQHYYPNNISFDQNVMNALERSCEHYCNHISIQIDLLFNYYGRGIEHYSQYRYQKEEIRNIKNELIRINIFTDLYVDKLTQYLNKTYEMLEYTIYNKGCKNKEQLLLKLKPCLYQDVKHNIFLTCHEFEEELEEIYKMDNCDTKNRTVHYYDKTLN